MKKTILILILFLGIYPTFHGGKLCINLTSIATAQGYGEEGGYEGDLCVLVPEACAETPPYDYYDQEHWNEVANNLDEILNNLNDAIEDANNEAYNEWINEMNDWVQDQIDEMDGIWAGFYEQSGPYDPGDAADWWDYINNLNNNNVNSNNPGYNPPPPDSAWFITVNGNDSIQYHRADTIYTMQRPGKIIKLTADRSPYATVPNMNWKRNDTLKCSSVAFCNFDVSNLGSYRVKVDSAGIKNLINVVVKVYPMPTFYFKRGANYNGEYGFDDSSHTHAAITSDTTFRRGTEIRTINALQYNVPWMSLLDGQTADIRDTLFNLSVDAKKDRNGKVLLIPSNNKITINGLSSATPSFNQLSVAHTLPIKAEEWDVNSETSRTIGSIYAITTFGDTIGKLNISCEKPVTKKIVIVYINTGTGYRNGVGGTNINKDTLINFLNAKSHNQIFKKWVIQNAFSDTLNLVNEFNMNPNAFAYDSLPRIFKKYYGLHKNLDMDSINQNPLKSYQPYINSDTGKTYFLYISDLLFATPKDTTNGDYPIGRASVHGSIFRGGNYIICSHELGHALYLDHTFYDVTNPPPSGAFCPSINKYTTNNIMDYVFPGQADKRRMLYFYQWLKSF